VVCPTKNRIILTGYREVIPSVSASDSKKRKRVRVRFTSRLAPSPLRLTIDDFFQFNLCGHSHYVIISLTRGWVCRLQLLLVLASAVILGSESVFYCLKFETPPPWRPRSPYSFPPGTGWPSYAPRHRVPFSSPPTCHRATMGGV
jgi:hypothetical protein